MYLITLSSWLSHVLPVPCDIPSRKKKEKEEEEKKAAAEAATAICLDIFSISFAQTPCSPLVMQTLENISHE